MVTKNQISQEIQVVKDETQLGANTKNRIAQIFDDINYYTVEMPVTYSSGQTLNINQQLQARTNIGAASDIFSYTLQGIPTFNNQPLSFYNSVSGSTTNGNIIINNVETPVYRLPSQLSPSIITQDANNSFVTTTQISNWNTAYSQTHTHSNKLLLDTYNQSNSDIISAINLKHNPVNIGISNGLSISGQTISMGTSSSTSTGSLTNTDWNSFRIAYNKIPTSLSTSGSTLILTLNDSSTLNTTINGGGSGSQITLTTSGYSGAATLSNNTLNIPNYTYDIASGSYTTDITNVFNITEISISNSTFYRIRNLVHVNIGGTLIPTSSGQISFTAALPISTASTSQSNIGIFTSARTGHAQLNTYIVSSTTVSAGASGSGSGSSCQFNFSFDYVLS